MASIVVRKLSDESKERLRQCAVRHKRSLQAEVRALLERAAQGAAIPGAGNERFPDWLIRLTRPGIDLDAGRGVPLNEVRLVLEGVTPFVHPHDEELALDTDAMHAITRRQGWSLGDRACLALARRLTATALMTDRAWGRVDLGVVTEVIR